MNIPAAADLQVFIEGAAGEDGDGTGTTDIAAELVCDRGLLDFQVAGATDFEIEMSTG